MTPDRTLLRAPALALLGVLTALGAAAQPQAQPTPEQAASLGAQITEWLTVNTAGALMVDAQAVQVSPEGDHTLVRVPLTPNQGTMDPADAAFTAIARPLDATRWSVEQQRFPPEITLGMTETVPDPPDAKDPSADGTHTEAATYHITLGQQDLHGIFDTSLATPSTSGGSIASIDVVKQSGAGTMTTHIGPTTTQTAVNPVDVGHADIVSDTQAEGYTLTSAMPDGSEWTIQADRLYGRGTLASLRQGQLVPLFRLIGTATALFKPPAPDAPDGPTAEQTAKLHDMLEQSRGMLTGAKAVEGVQGLTFELAGSSGKVGKLEISLDAAAPGNTLSGAVGIVLDGLVLDSVPPPLAAYVPSHIAIHPTVANLDAGVLTKMALDATAPGPDGKAPLPPDAAALFGGGGIAFGFDTLEMSVADAQLTGTGAFTSTGPKSVTGKADLSATGLDGLITRAQADPVLQQAVPVLIFLKGIATTSGDRATWQITVDNAKVLVNGVDLSAMAGSMRR